MKISLGALNELAVYSWGWGRWVYCLQDAPPMAGLKVCSHADAGAAAFTDGTCRAAQVVQAD